MISVMMMMMMMMQPLSAHTSRYIASSRHNCKSISKHEKIRSAKHEGEPSSHRHWPIGAIMQASTTHSSGLSKRQYKVALELGKHQQSQPGKHQLGTHKPNTWAGGTREAITI